MWRWWCFTSVQWHVTLILTGVFHQLAKLKKNGKSTSPPNSKVQKYVSKTQIKMDMASWFFLYLIIYVQDLKVNKLKPVKEMKQKFSWEYIWVRRKSMQTSRITSKFIAEIRVRPFNQWDDPVQVSTLFLFNEMTWRLPSTWVREVTKEDKVTLKALRFSGV